MIVPVGSSVNSVPAILGKDGMSPVLLRVSIGEISPLRSIVSRRTETGPQVITRGKGKNTPSPGPPVNISSPAVQRRTWPISGAEKTHLSETPRPRERRGQRDESLLGGQSQRPCGWSGRPVCHLQPTPLSPTPKLSQRDPGLSQSSPPEGLLLGGRRH